MLGMFLKGLVGGAARGFSTAIKTRNKELRDMWDTAQQKYLDTIARETQQRALQRTQLLERMGRIESKGPAGTLTPAELYLLSKDDQTFGQVINDIDKGILTLAQVKKNIAFNGKSSPCASLATIESEGTIASRSCALCCCIPESIPKAVFVETTLGLTANDGS